MALILLRRCSTTEAQYHAAAQSLVSLGLSALGYHYFNLYGSILEIFLGILKIKSSDCGWQSTARDSAGKITWDPKIASPSYRCSEFSLRLPSAAVWSTGTRDLRAQSRTQVRCLFRFVCYETSATDRFILIRYFPRGIFACDFVGGTAHYVGSLGHETSDAATFASWCVDIFSINTTKQS